MQSEVDEIIALMQEWKIFKATGKKELADFGDWLKVKSQPLNPQSETATEFDAVKEIYFQNNQDENLILNSKIGVLLSKLESYNHYLAKKALAELPIKNTDEFVLLIFLQFYPKMKKTDFIKETLMESTTAFEMMKRLAKQGLIEESESDADKRAKVMSLTEKGVEVLEQAKIEINKVNRLALGNLSLADKKKLEEILNYLDIFHYHIHENQREDSLDKILEDNIF